MGKKKILLNRLNQPVHPVLAVLLISLIAIGVTTFFDTNVLQFFGYQTGKEPPLTTPVPTPTLAPGQKAIYTFYIQGGNRHDEYDASGKPVLKPEKSSGHSGIMLDASLSGRTAELPVGTKIVLYFPGGGFDISVNPTKGVVEKAKGTYNLPRNEIGVLEVVGQGPATITVTNVNYKTTFITPTPTLAPGQKAIYTFYIQAAPHKVNPRALSVTPFDTGKTFSVDIGTLIALRQFVIGNYHISVSSPQAIFKDFNQTKSEFMSVPADVIGAVRVYRAGIGTIQVIETDSAPTPTPTPFPHTTYTSDKLGISFTYINTVADVQNFYTREIGNKVYLYPGKLFTGTDAEFLQSMPGGFSVEVFNKDPKLSLTDAIKQQFLTGYSEADCPIGYCQLKEFC